MHVTENLVYTSENSTNSECGISLLMEFPSVELIILSINSCYTEEGFYQMWDDYIWMTPTTSHLHQIALLCWKPKSYSFDYWPNITKNVGWMPPHWCEDTLVLQ